MIEALNKSEKLLAVLPWNYCNATCQHCMNDSGPNDKRRLSNEIIKELIIQAKNIYGSSWHFAISGGEAFVHYDELLDLIAFSKSKGAYVSVFTNCHWAKNIMIAKKMLQPLVDNGLIGLGISSDFYHLEYVPLDNIKNAIIASRCFNLKVQLRCVGSCNFRLSKLLSLLEDIPIYGTEFVELPLSPFGRASKLLMGELITQDEMPGGKCPAPTFAIDFEGRGLACCNGGGHNFGLGDVYSHTLGQLKYRFYTDVLFHYIRNNPLINCFRWLNEKDINYLRSIKYTEECHLCHELFSDVNRRNTIKLGIEKLFQAYCTSLFDSSGNSVLGKIEST